MEHQHIPVLENDEMETSPPFVAEENTQELEMAVTPFDVTLKIGDVPYQAHRRILASAIPAFKEAFKECMDDVNPIEFNMPADFDHTSLGLLIHLAYTKELKVELNQLPMLIVSSLKLDFHSLSEMCLQRLWENINPINALMTRECSQIVNNVILKEKIEHFIRRHFDEVCLTDGFLLLSYAALQEIICGSSLNIKDEETVLEAIIRWIKSSEIDRSCHLIGLLRHVRLPAISPEYLTNLESSENLIQASPLCRKMFKEAKIAHHWPEGNLSTKKGKVNVKCYLSSVDRMGFGMHAVGITNSGLFFINFYNPFKRVWNSLYLSRSQFSLDYVICTTEKMYFIAMQEVRVLDLTSLKFTEAPSMDYSPACSGIIFHDRKVYFLGNVLFLNSKNVMCYHPESGKCVYIGDMLISRMDPGLTTLSDSIYITGGRHHPSGMLSSMEMYNPVSKICTELAPMHQSRYGHGCATLQGKIYVCGGDPGVVRRSCSRSTAEVYDPITDEWSFIANMNDARLCVYVFSHSKNRLYVVDADSHDDFRFEMESYDPKKKVWKYEGSIPSLEGRTVAVILTNTASVLWRS